MTSTDLWKRPKEHYPFAFADVVEWCLKAPHKDSNRDELAAAKAILMRQGKPATHRNLVALCGIKLGAMSDLADAASENAATWGKGRYWKLDGVSPEVKEAARRAAHRAGEGVGPWLDGLLLRELGMPAAKHLSRAQVPTHSPMNLFLVVQVRGTAPCPCVGSAYVIGVSADASQWAAVAEP